MEEELKLTGRAETVALFRKARTYWRMALFGAPLYLFIMAVFKGDRGEPFDFQQFYNSPAMLWWAGAWSLVITIMGVLTWQRRVTPVDPRRWWIYFTCGLLLLDTMMIVAFGFWWFTRRSEVFIISACVSYVLLAVAHPRINELR